MEQTIITTYYHLRGTKNPPPFPAYNTSAIADASERLPVRKHIIGIHFLVRPAMRKLTLGGLGFSEQFDRQQRGRVVLLGEKKDLKKKILTHARPDP